AGVFLVHHQNPNRRKLFSKLRNQFLTRSPFTHHYHRVVRHIHSFVHSVRSLFRGFNRSPKQAQLALSVPLYQSKSTFSGTRIYGENGFFHYSNERSFTWK